MKILSPLAAIASLLSRISVYCGLVLLVQFAFVATTNAQTPTTLQGKVIYQFPDSRSEPAAGVTVTMTKTFTDVSPPVVSTQTTSTDGDGHYSFQSTFRCSVSYQFQAVSSEMVDDEALPPSGISGTGGCVGDATLGDLSIKKPLLITLGGYTKDVAGNPVQGITVTMTRTKYDLHPNVVTTATTTTNANGHYEFITYSRCSVVESFKPSIGNHIFGSYISPSGCIVGDVDNLNLLVEFSAGRDAGSPGCHGVGRPVNVTNGNMYLQQTDHYLPGIGAAINITRAYNSSSQSIGLFGRGWTSLYDESVIVNSDNLLEFKMGEGRVVTGGITPDFFGQIVKNGDGSYTVTLKSGGTHQFNSAGKLVSLRDRNGNQTTLTYGTNGRLTSVTDPFGRVLSFTSNSGGRIVAISDTLGTIASYTYGSSNQLLSVTYADNSAHHFAYIGGGGGLLLTDVTDALGNVVEHHNYDSLARATTSEAQGGVEKYTLNYVSPMETHVTDALGHVTKYFFHSVRGRNAVTRIEGSCSCGGGAQVKSRSYDDQLNISTRTDALGHVTSYTFDGSGNPVTITDATGTVVVSYNQFGEPLTLSDQLGGTTTNSYDVQGNLLAIKDALNNTSTFTFNSRGQILTATDARGKVSTFTYDTAGNLAQSRDANNITTFYFYDARGRLTKVRDGLSRNSLYAYDPAGRINKVTHADNSFVSVSYDLAGRRTAVIDERGNPTNFSYDNAYRLTSTTDALGHVTSYGYDAMSNLRSVTDALSRVTNYEYDDFDRMVKVEFPEATPGAARLFAGIAYDANGNVIRRSDTAGRNTTFTYDNVNRLASTTDANNQITTFEYDELSRTTALTDATNQRYEFAYDAIGRQTQVGRAGMSMNYVYDAVGNMTQRADYNGGVTNYAYDNRNRLTTVNYPTRTVTYAYDPLGNLTRATNENGSVYIGYDNRYRISSFSDPFYYGVSYNYDAAGNRTKLSLNGTTYATYTYDAVNRLTNLKDGGNLNFPQTYDAVNRLMTRSAPNGVTTSYVYDGLNRLTTLTHAGANTLTADQYSYNDAGNISTWNNSAGSRAYTYDSVDRLTTATGSVQPNENYAYDGVGNRTSSLRGADYAYQPFNRLTSTATSNYTYDSNGNMLTRTDASGTTTFSWNEENQLTQVSLPGGLTVNHKYDALGRRIQRSTSGGTSERYVYDGQDVILDLSADWTVATKYLNGPGIDNHLRQTSATTGNSYFLTDHLGSTSVLTDDAGNAVEQQVYDSFGNNPGSLRTRYGYTGRERDPDTGLLHYRARSYDPVLGRFISEDPIGLAGGINSFAYVSNNALNAKDPSGLFEIDVHYYLTYFLARKTGCFKEWEAHDIANEDQRTDEDPTTMPAFGDTDQQQMQNRVFHTFHTGSAEGVGSPLLWQGAMNESGGHIWIGRYLHHLQDTYSHAGFSDAKWGHSPFNRLFGNLVYGDHAVDKTASDPAKAMRMAGMTWHALAEYGKAKGCGCNPQWDNAWIKQINDFINVTTSDPRWSTIDALIPALDNPGWGDPAALKKKRRILDLPDRTSGEW